jgi:hypothetical protein
MTTEAGPENAVDLAVRRLDRALLQLEQRVAQRVATANAGAGQALEEDRAQLAAALDRARGRERELEEAGAAASQALAAAITQIKDALEAPEEAA